jgi:putative ABC transport system permease protein
MNKFFYVKLACSNLKRNAKTCFPFILTCIGTIAMFYNMCFLSLTKSIGVISDYVSLRYILILGMIVVGIFSAVFLFYTNNFLIRQRKKEFGLFNILGMEKRHIARVMFCETLIMGLVSIILGLLVGILFSKLLILLLLKLISFDAVFGFEVPGMAVMVTILLFAGIFMMILLNNFIQVYRSKPVDLLKSTQQGEKEPKTKWVQTILGVVCLGVGYYIALTTESPLAALNLFFVAVLLVIAGTCLLFTAGSIAILKAMRKNKKYYYRANHFTSVSGMIYRMKQNAAGLANICILSTAVIIMLSTTISLYLGMENVLRTRYPRNIVVYGTAISDDQVNKLDAMIVEQARKAGANPINLLRYRLMNFTMQQNGASFSTERDAALSPNEIALFEFLTQEDYNKIANTSVSLNDGEALLYVLRGEIPGDTLNFNGLELTIRDRLDSFGSEGKMSAILAKSYFVIVHNTETIEEIYHALNGSSDMGPLSYQYGFDTDADRDVQINLVNILQQEIEKLGVNAYAEGSEAARASFYSLYGGLFFLGIFLGLLFMMATVLIIYYKQIAEGYDDRERFIIMQKVGMSHAEVKKSIHSQVLTVFFLPLLTAVVHLAFSFKVITKLLSIFNLTDIALFVACMAITVLVFALLYGIVYSRTAKVYYKIVSA